MSQLTYSQVSERIQEDMFARGEWSGVPVPMPGHDLVLESKSPWREKLEGLFKEESSADCGLEPGETLRSQFFCRAKNVTVYILEKEGRVYCVAYREQSHEIRRLTSTIQTLGPAAAWSLEAEMVATEALAEQLNSQQRRTYLLTGTFIETSKRSQISYLFRKNRPTLALSTSSGSVVPLCALCLHPIGYYEGTWAGAMVPTDEIFAHLMLMRGDEKMFWRRANQHPLWRPEAGV